MNPLIIIIILIVIIILLVIVANFSIKTPDPDPIQSTETLEIDMSEQKPRKIDEIDEIGEIGGESRKINTISQKLIEINAIDHSSIGLYNLSVRKTDEGFSGLVRGCNYKCLIQPKEPPMSYPYYIRLNNKGKIEFFERIKFDYSQFTNCKKKYKGVDGNGLEDPKLFIYKNEEWAIVSCLGSKNQHHPCVNTMAIFKISSPQETFRLLSVPDWIDKEQRQKNWSPFEYDGHLLCEYSLEPHIILEIDPNTGITREFCRSGKEGIDIILGTSLRGGGAPIYIPEKDIYLGIGHTRISNELGYVHFFYAFEAKKPFNIISISKTFKLDKREWVQFAACISHNDNQIYISYGVDDCSNRISIYSFDYVMSMLNL